MGKEKLAICIGDPKYQERFIKCLMNHYQEQYEIHFFTELLELKEATRNQYSAIIIGGDCSKADVLSFIKTGCIIVYLQDIDSHLSGEMFSSDSEEIIEKLIFLDKFQEVYKIMEKLEMKLDGNSNRNLYKKDSSKDFKRIGVFSLENLSAQLPYGAMLAMLYGEKNPTIFLNLMPHSGMIETEEDVLSLEDLMAAIATESYTRNRMLGGINHMQKWDYVYPVKNAETLSEASRETYESLIEILEKEVGYQTVVINFGAIFPGWYDLMESCDEFYLLQSQEAAQSWRERSFMHELERRGKSNFLNRILRIKAPTALGGDGSWEKLAERWAWGSFGDDVRQTMWGQS